MPEKATNVSLVPQPREFEYELKGLQLITCGCEINESGIPYQLICLVKEQ